MTNDNQPNRRLHESAEAWALLTEAFRFWCTVAVGDHDLPRRFAIVAELAAIEVQEGG